jgi:transcriptional regulator with XRE-family HTH domain
MLERRQAGGRNSAEATRLRWLRAAEGNLSSTDFASRVGWSLSQLSNYENGIRLSRDAAIQLKEKVEGLTIDWLWFGAEEGLSPSLRRRLRIVRDAKKSTKPAGLQRA